MSSQPARDVREISDSSQVFEHHGWARNTSSFTGTGARIYEPLLPCSLGPTRMKPHPRTFLLSSSSSSFSLSLRGKKGGSLGAAEELSCCHSHIGDGITEPESARADIACPFEWCSGARQRLVNSPRAILDLPVALSRPVRMRVGSIVPLNNWCLKQNGAGVCFSAGAHKHKKVHSHHVR